MLNADDIAGIEAQVVESLDDTCTILRETRTSDGMGGQTVSYSEVDQPEPYDEVLPCRVVRSDLGNVVEKDRVVTVARTTLSVPKVADVQMGDVVEIDETWWKVSGLPQPGAATKALQVVLYRP